jgi:CDP-diacylglycerol---serine O-phosphatidyltransferase
VAAFVWFSSGWREPGLVGLIAAFLVTVIAGLLMVSSFSYPSFKQFDMDRRIKRAYMIIVPLFFVLIALDPPTMLLSLFATYAASAPVLWAVRRIRRTSRGAPAAPGPS